MQKNKNALSQKVFVNHGEALLSLGMAARGGHYPFLSIDWSQGGQPLYGELDSETFMQVAEVGIPKGIPLVPLRISESSKSRPDYVGLRDVATVTIYE